MKIVTRIRQLLSAKEDVVSSGGESIPKPIVAPAEATPRREIERPSTPLPSTRVLMTPNTGGLHLEGEGIEQPITDPSEDVLRREIGRLRTAGPSHLALIAADGSYLQAAGNAKRMTVEGHFVNAQNTRHVVLGRQGPPGSTITIGSTAGPIDVRASEVWAAPEAIELFGAFAETGSVPSDVSSRDITAGIASQ